MKKKPKKPMPAPQRALHYKVVELSSVDEAAIERTLNEWCQVGWTFDGVQFAMRESSKRPSMAFVFFTREGGPVRPGQDFGDDAFRSPQEAQSHLGRLAHREVKAPSSAAWERLHALANDDADDEVGDR
jgi:hypothetical protein